MESLEAFALPHLTRFSLSVAPPFDQIQPQSPLPAKLHSPIPIHQFAFGGAGQVRSCSSAAVVDRLQVWVEVHTIGSPPPGSPVCVGKTGSSLIGLGRMQSLNLVLQVVKPQTPVSTEQLRRFLFARLSVCLFFSSCEVRLSPESSTLVQCLGSGWADFSCSFASIDLPSTVAGCYMPCPHLRVWMFSCFAFVDINLIQNIVEDLYGVRTYTRPVPPPPSF